jgi:hypothetical protein
MPDFQWVELFQQLFGNEIVKWILIVLFPLAVLFAFLWLIKGIIEITKSTFIPLFYDKDKKRRIRRRQRFADYIETEIRRINQREDWSDFHFAELEAEVETEGRSNAFSFIPFIKSTTRGLRKEKSLSKALRTSQERFMLLEGDPGSGKSVALRHVALNMTKRAIKSKSEKSIIPIYLNLKELRRTHRQEISRELIQDFILKSLKRVNDRDVERFLEEEFQRGLENGTWFYLFDSFDEIPEILGAEDADAIIKKYADAIFDFLHGLNNCRGVVASRYFKGPGKFGWPRFRVIKLTPSKQIELIKRSELQSSDEKLLIGNLEIANPEVRKMAANPLFLGLLITYFQSNKIFPTQGEIVFDAYINHRFVQDYERLRRRFHLEVEEIRRVAEAVAFCMSASDKLGLSPTRGNVKSALANLKIKTGNNFDDCLDALEFIKLGRSETGDVTGDQRIFTFSHRRFQEYFATKKVLESEKVSEEELLTNPRWRETTVVICQSQPLEDLIPILDTAWLLLSTYFEDIRNKLESLISEKELPNKEFPIEFPWPKRCLHVIGLLQDGFSNRKDDLPERIQKIAGSIVSLATLCGIMSDRIWALDVAGVIPPQALLEIIRPAINDKSYFLSEIAYRQVSKLEHIPHDINIWIKKAILKRMLANGLMKQNHVVFAQVSRLINSKDYIAVIRGIQFGYSLEIITSVIAGMTMFLFVLGSSYSGSPINIAISGNILNVLIGIIIMLAPFLITSEEDKTPTNYMFPVIARTTVLLGAVLFSLFITRNNFFIIYIILLYLSLVMPFLLISVDNIPFERGVFLSVFSPFFAISKVFKELAKSFRSVPFAKNKYWLIGLILITLVLCIVAIKGTQNRVIRVIMDRFAIVLGIALTILYGYPMPKILKSIREYLKDEAIWRTWIHSGHKEMDAEEMVVQLASFSWSNTVRYIRAIRERNLLIPSLESVAYIKQLIRIIEAPSTNSELSHVLQRLLVVIGDNKYTSELLDELFQLLEQTRARIQA